MSAEGGQFPRKHHKSVTQEDIMGFTIEDMVTETGSKYQMRMLAGANGWSNSISWILMVEDMTILQNFKGKDLAVTTGLGFPEPASSSIPANTSMTSRSRSSTAAMRMTFRSLRFPGMSFSLI